MKNKIEITKVGDRLHFYLHNDGGMFWLFSQKCTKGVYQFFENGRSEAEIRSYRNWGRNERLNKTIMRIPKMTEYVMKYEM